MAKAEGYGMFVLHLKTLIWDYVVVISKKVVEIILIYENWIR